ncbi:hypothetical protein [Idiomarina abyssalis]|uniref:hypothetical protein n=1 Tax=Idiomarina abyssalis TaxID=86102 RepID=UPI003A932492
MIYISQPLEVGNPQEAAAWAEQGQFITNLIMSYLPNRPLYNFPLQWIKARADLNLAASASQTSKMALQFLGRAEGVIFTDLPGAELCPRTTIEKTAARRLEIPTAVLPFYRQRFEQQKKQSALLGDQKRVLNLFSSLLEES